MRTREMRRVEMRASEKREKVGVGGDYALLPSLSISYTIVPLLQVENKSAC